MAQAVLNLHSGGHIVTREELDQIQPPPPTSTWFPTKHSDVLDCALQNLDAAGFSVLSQQLAIHKDGNRFFAVMDLRADLAPGITLAVAIRNSTDRSFPMALAMGSRTFCCSNLAISGTTKIQRKHTRHGRLRFQNAMAQGIQSLREFQAMETQRIEVLQNHELTPHEADSYLLRSFEQGIVSAPVLPKVIKEYREPSYPEFTPRTAFSLLSAYTTVMADRAVSNPAAYASMTMRLQQFLLQ